jgi:hypothetical protein
MIKVYWLYENETDNIFTDGYIGITKNTTVRFYQHKAKFGNFKTKVIFYGSLEQCMALELQLRPKPGIGWNRAIGGFEGYRLGHSEETIKVIKEKRANQVPPTLGKSHSEETKLKIKTSNVGKVRSAEVRANMKAAKQFTPDHVRAKMSASHTGKKLSEQAKAKVVAALTGRPVSEETKRKISEAQKGKIITAEQRKNMSEAKWVKKNLDYSNIKMLN